MNDPMDNVKPLKGAVQVPAGIFSAADLQGRVFPPIKWIVPDILPEGLTLLAGKPKLGKSWLALDIAVAVASGGSVLGRECEPGPVLCLALEDNQRRLQRRLQRVAGSTSWPRDLEFHTEWSRLPIIHMADLDLHRTLQVPEPWLSEFRL